MSDLHLGTRGCQASLILDFLKYHDADTIFLVGDIVDGWQLRRNWYWPQQHTDVIRAFLRKSQAGTRLVYLPGNHDEVLRDFPGIHFGGVEVIDQVVHTLGDGRRLLVLHGDQFDIVVRYAPWLAVLGSGAYVTVLSINTVVNRVRRRLGRDYWSLSAWAKAKVKNAVKHIGQFEVALAAEARRREVNGVVCGHIHHAKIETRGEFVYVNAGDWVESCTAIGEHQDGQLELIKWTEAGGLARDDEATPRAGDEAAVQDAAE
ncbi:MAG: UDP-2,3-diacylglucosamine diphosphatase [Alphaproteobacteria bacterium]